MNFYIYCIGFLGILLCVMGLLGSDFGTFLGDFWKRVIGVGVFGGSLEKVGFVLDLEVYFV